MRQLAEQTQILFEQSQFRGRSEVDGRNLDLGPIQAHVTVQSGELAAIVVRRHHRRSMRAEQADHVAAEADLNARDKDVEVFQGKSAHDQASQYQAMKMNRLVESLAK